MKRSLKNIISHSKTIICGDFNSHHLWWNSAVSEAEVKKAAILVNWLQQFQFDLISEPDNGTFHRSNLVKISNIDLVFSISNISQYMSWWKDEDYTIGSKHDMIFFSISKEDKLVENPLYACQYNFEKANWKKINEDIQLEQDNTEFQWSLNEISKDSLELEAEKLQNLIIKIVEKHIPKKKLCEKSKPWWSKNLTTLRKKMAKYRRIWKRKADSTAEHKYIDIRKQYYYEIKSAKTKCWNNFLENARDKDIFKAFQYTK